MFLRIAGMGLCVVGIAALTALPFVRMSYSKFGHATLPAKKDGPPPRVIRYEIISDGDGFSMGKTVLLRMTLLTTVAWITFSVGTLCIAIGNM
jgi:hypothetical protein